MNISKPRIKMMREKLLQICHAWDVLIYHLRINIWPKVNTHSHPDRILCFEIFTKKKEKWLLRYIPEAKASTDAPENLGVFLNQRRRWLNGSLFAFISAFVHMGNIWKTTHPFGRKLGFILEMFYLLLDTFMSLIGPMNFFAVFICSIINIAGTLKISLALVFALGFAYIVVFIFGIIVFVGNNPRGSQLFYVSLSRLWAIVMLLVLVAIGYNSYLLFVNSPRYLLF